MARTREFNISALSNLAAVFSHYRLNVSAEDLCREYDVVGESVSTVRFLRMARENGLEAGMRSMRWNRLHALDKAFPVLGVLKNGETLVFSGFEQGESRSDDRLVLFTGEGLQFMERAAVEEIWSGEVILFKPVKQEGEKRFGLLWFGAQVLFEKRIFSEVVIIALVLNLLAFAIPLYFQNVVDKVLAHHAVTTLHVMGIGVVGAVLFEGILRFLREYLLRFATSRIDLRLAMKTFARLVRLPLDFFERSFAGVVVKHMQQVEQIREFLTGNMLETMLDATALLVFLPILYLYSPKLTFIVLGFAVLTAICIGLMLGPFYGRLLRLYDAEGRRQALLVETITGMNTVKSLALEPSRNKRWEDGSAQSVSSNFSVEQMAAAGQAIIKTLERLMTVSVIWVGVSSVFEGTMTVGALIAFQMLSQNVTTPLIRLVELVHEYQKTHLAVNMLGEIMNRRPEPGFDRRGTRPEIQGGLEISNLSFSYVPGESPALESIDLNIEPGEVLGVVGRSGSGKTTLTRLIQGLYPVQKGNIAFDGTEIREMDIRHLRDSIGVVLQENFIFHGSVRENIGLARPGADFEKIVAAAKLAGADEFIRKLPQGYETILDENGANLSGGQKQRLAIARALMKDPGLIIFDEATSALDPESEYRIQENLEQIAEGRSMIIVAHRLSTLRHADRIIVMEDGSIDAQGTHKELLMASLIYRNLWEKQTRGMEAA
ncbi:peptidase domain-containing ABC transporter [Maridesulfovibrio sp.]|uniref:peptidase domain-containing ABC transporter n=1 Tax=unclassified Maridesulfovibrio TaxID=2794999 RepID=UPI003AFFEDC5